MGENECVMTQEASFASAVWFPSEWHRKNLNKPVERQIQAGVIVIVVERTWDWLDYLPEIEIHDLNDLMSRTLL